MGKGKLTLLDVRALVKELRAKLIGLRVANIYHLSAKTFLFRLSGSDLKHTLLVESGARMHTTQYAREHDKLPSNFCAKLRKHLRMQKLEDIQQVGNDRIVDLSFGRGEKTHHLILEFYDQGNIILTDATYQIIMLLRTHTYGATPSVGTGGMDSSALPSSTPALASRPPSSSKPGHKGKAKAAARAADGDAEGAEAEEDEVDRVAVRAIYPMSQVQMPQQHITLDMVEACLQKQLAKERAEAAAMAAASVADASAAEPSEGKEEETTEAKAPEADDSSLTPVDDSHRNQQGKKQQAKEQQKIDAARQARANKEAEKKLAKPKMKQGMPIKAVLAQDLHFGPDVIEHCLLLANIDPLLNTSSFLAQAAAAAAAPEADSSADASSSSSSFSPALLNSLCAALQEAPKLLDRISTEAMPGYIFWKVEREATAKPAQQQQQQQQQPKKQKPEKQKRNKAGELVVDEMDVGATVAGAVSAATTSAAAPASDASVAASTSADAAATPSQTASTDDAVAPAAAAPSSSSATSAASPCPADASSSASDGGLTIYTEYVPLLLATHSSRPEYRSMPEPMQFPSFDNALDEFYSKQEAQKEAQRLLKEKAQALQKLEREKQRQATQLDALASQQALSTLKAQLIEAHLDAVNACIGAVNAEIAKGVDWRELTRMIKAEKSNPGNPVARMIHSLKLLENQITVTLSEGLAHLLPENAGGNKRIPVYHIELDLGISAYANAQNYYTFKKKHAVKQSKAESASAQAIAAAERKTTQALSAVDQRARIQKARKVFWWEKFHWFISSENFLVIGGKDAQQNETLVKRYLKKNDIYVHAEVHGASSVVVKNHTLGPVPPLTLSQAGSMTICRSAAWKNTIIVESYWVHADQVSKSAPTGLHLPTGSFMVRGRKNFLPRMPLVMGVGLLFKLDDSCRAKHAGERRVRTAADESTQGEDKFDQVGELPSLGSSAADAATHRSSSAKKKSAASGSSGSGSSSSKKKKKPAAPAPSDLDDFDVTSNLAAVPSAAAAAAIGRLTSEDEASDAEEKEKRARIEQLASGDKPKAPPAGGKKKMSAAERKRLKKQGTAGGQQQAAEEKAEEGQGEEEEEEKAAAAPAPASSQAADDSSSEGDDWGPKKRGKKKARGKPSASSSAAAPSAPAAPAAAPSKPLPRGKRSKLKRVAARYANQDEEDLVLAASLLGLQNVAAKKAEVAAREKKFTAKKGEEEEEENEEESEESDEEGEKEKDASAAASSATAAAPADADDSSKICFHCKERGHVFKSCPHRSSDSADASGSGSSGTTFAQARRAAENAEESEVARLMAEEGVIPEEDEPEDSNAQAEAELSGLTGRPFPDDLCHFIVPVCAPYDALASYKFKLKLVPGAMKKGKAASQSLSLFQQQAAVTPAEKEMLKLVPEQEVINVLPSNIKLSAPGQQGDGGKKKKNKPTAARLAILNAAGKPAASAGAPATSADD